MSLPPERYDFAIVGIVGLPAKYGGFETLAEHLVAEFAPRHSIQVFCSAKRNVERPTSYNGAVLEYINFDANGPQSIIYDAIALFRGMRRARTILILGVSGCIVLPLIRFLSPSLRIVTNIDGLEWRRQKWSIFAKIFLRMSECIAVRFSDVIVADNEAIREYVAATYHRSSEMIPYGGDAAVSVDAATAPGRTHFAPRDYYFTVCRIEPENNIDAILTAFLQTPALNLVIVGNWHVSTYATELRARFSGAANIELLDPIYDRGELDALRGAARAYVHGHSAGGTNPSLVEAMSLALPILAYDVSYNRHATHEAAAYWKTVDDLVRLIVTYDSTALARNAKSMRELADAHYTWRAISARYADVLFPHLNADVTATKFHSP